MKLLCLLVFCCISIANTHASNHQDVSSITSCFESIDLEIKKAAPILADFLEEESVNQVGSEDNLQIDFWKYYEIPDYKMTASFPREHHRKEESYKTFIQKKLKYGFMVEDPSHVDCFYPKNTSLIRVDYEDNSYRLLNVKSSCPFTEDDFKCVKKRMKILLKDIIKEVLEVNELGIDDFEFILKDIQVNEISAIIGVVDQAFEVTLIRENCFFGKARFILFNSMTQYCIATILTEDLEHANEFLNRLFFGKLLEITNNPEEDADSRDELSWDFIEVPNACMKITLPADYEILEDFTEDIVDDAFYQYFAVKHSEGEYYFHNQKNFKALTTSEINDYLQEACQEYEQQGYRIEFKQQPSYFVNAPYESDYNKHVNFVFDISLFKREKFQGKTRIIFLCDYTQICKLEAFSNTRNSDKFVNGGSFFYILRYGHLNFETALLRIF